MIKYGDYGVGGGDETRVYDPTNDIDCLHTASCPSWTSGPLSPLPLLYSSSPSTRVRVTSMRTTFSRLAERLLNLRKAGAALLPPIPCVVQVQRVARILSDSDSDVS